MIKSESSISEPVLIREMLMSSDLANNWLGMQS